MRAISLALAVMPVPPITLSVGLMVEVPVWVIPVPAVTEVTVPLALATHVLSPLRKVEESAVPLPSLAVGTVPLPKAEALRAVILEPAP